ncbi:MAG: S-adenosylmethionine:tRNA ribosyltransferase-isomerase [Kiritimatiellia bacterium]
MTTILHNLVRAPGGIFCFYLAGRWIKLAASMLTSDFDYNLPPELIAQAPAPARDRSRLMLVERATGAIGHYHASDLPELLRPGDLMVVNDTRVIPARLFGKKPKTGGKVEVLFIAEINNYMAGRNSKGVGTGCQSGRSDGLGAAGQSSPALPAERDIDVQRKEVQPVLWEAFLHLSGRPKVGDSFMLAGDKVRAELKSIGERGRVILELHCAGDFLEILENDGLPPLPPYIKRPRQKAGTDSLVRPIGKNTAGQAVPPYHKMMLDNSSESQIKIDRERYQTVYARAAGAIAAPTAGLHLSTELLEALAKAGVDRTEITLHVGPGTFTPVRSEKVEDHRMEKERFIVPEASAAKINAALAARRRIVAVGTTTVRTLESVAGADGQIAPGSGETGIFIYPPFRFRAVGALLTNFHLPKSTLLMLVSAFACPQGCARSGSQDGLELIRRAYETAVREKYRFYSYGDCMLIV